MGEAIRARIWKDEKDYVAEIAALRLAASGATPEQSMMSLKKLLEDLIGCQIFIRITGSDTLEVSGENGELFENFLLKRIEEGIHSDRA